MRPFAFCLFIVPHNGGYCHVQAVSSFKSSELQRVFALTFLPAYFHGLAAMPAVNNVIFYGISPSPHCFVVSSAFWTGTHIYPNWFLCLLFFLRLLAGADITYYPVDFFFLGTPSCLLLSPPAFARGILRIQYVQKLHILNLC